MIIGTPTFGGDGGKSGISRYIVQLLREFASMAGGSQMEVLLYEDEKHVFLPATGGLASVGFGRAARHPLRDILWHQIPLPLWCRKRAYDVLFLPAANRRLPLAVPCPTVGTVHDLSSLHVADKYDSGRLFYIKKVLPFLIRRLTRVLTVSESSKADIVNYAGVDPGQITVTPLAVDPTVYYPRDPAESSGRMRDRLGISTPYILYISRIEHPGKNHVQLIRAFDRLKNRGDVPHHLVLAGSDWNRAEEVHREAAAAEYAYAIHFTGFVSNDILPDLYSGADVFVFPSRYEGFGLPLLEAMACGVPAACSRVSSLPEVAGDAALMFDPNDPEDMAGVLDRLISDQDLRRTCIERGLARSATFTWQRTARQTMQVLQEAAQERTR